MKAFVIALKRRTRVEYLEGWDLECALDGCPEFDVCVWTTAFEQARVFETDKSAKRNLYCARDRMTAYQLRDLIAVQPVEAKRLRSGKLRAIALA